MADLYASDRPAGAIRADSLPRHRASSSSCPQPSPIVPDMTSSDSNPSSAPAAEPESGQRRVALRIVTLPRDTNPYGTVFGGVMLSYIDQAGFVEARRHGAHRWVTVAIDRVEFKKPVQVGDTVTFYTSTLRLGTTSVTVRVEVEAERYQTGETVSVTEAAMTLVAVGPDCRPIPFAAPATVVPAAAAGGPTGACS